jgi:uncharacterized membrane protein YqjE
MANSLERAPEPRTPLPSPRGEMAEVQDESTPSLIRSAFADVGDIVRAEVNLAVVEIRDDAKKLVRTLPMGAAGGVLAALGAVFLLHTIALALDVALPGWAAYLIVTVVALAVGATLLLITRRRLADWKSFVPERTIESLEENKRWIQRKLS